MKGPRELPDRSTHEPAEPLISPHIIANHLHGYCDRDCPLCADERAEQLELEPAPEVEA